MKFALNGALTIGTLDGANVEIREAVGAENFFLFGLTAEEVRSAAPRGYRPRDVYRAEPAAARGARPDRLARRLLARRPRRCSARSSTALLERDEYMRARRLSRRTCELPGRGRRRRYATQTRWTRMSILNMARMGSFSSDRAIREYCEDIWQVSPVPWRSTPGAERRSPLPCRESSGPVRPERTSPATPLWTRYRFMITTGRRAPATE